MPNILDENGLQIKSNSEIITDLTSAFKGIYGSNINVDSNSPDGQMLNIYAQVAIDNLELLLDVYNSINPDNAYGTILDQRVAINGVQRREGTFTFTFVEITIDRALNLEGLDDDIYNPDGTGYIVSDDAGTQFILVNSASLHSPGTFSMNFRAKDIGKVEVLPNTIKNQVTSVLGVTNVNNSGIFDPTIVGSDEETDAELKIRRANSFSLGSTGASDSIQSAILNISDVIDALVVENDTSSTVDTIPPHSVWIIVEGGSDEDIGTAIYSKKSPGCGMKGSESYVIIRPNGTSFKALFDRTISEDLYIKFGMIPKNPGVTFDNVAIKQSLVDTLNYKLNQPANIGDIVTAMLTIEPLAILTDVAVSVDDIDYFNIVYPLTFQHKFAVATDRITIL